jgi:hypothetical protein
LAAQPPDAQNPWHPLIERRFVGID